MTSFVQRDSTPKTAQHVVRWFNDVEAPKGVGKERDGSISVWFHGEDLMMHGTIHFVKEAFSYSYT